ncbi:MAG: acyltransferase family protein [Clostridia bacterium]|nr:acyltransferase family protein [Clostridia bacterium]
MDRENERLSYIDIAKGIGILMVIFGHVLNKSQGLYCFIYSVHIPLFIILSGFFEKEHSDFRTYFYKTIRRLYLPFLAFVVIDYIAAYFLNDTPAKYVFVQGVKAAMGMERVFNQPIWFLFDLFVVKVFIQLFHKIRNKKLMNLLLAVVMICGVYYMYCCRFIDFSIRYIPINSVIPFMSYYIFGYFMKGSVKYVADIFEGRDKVAKFLMSVVMIHCLALLVPLSQINGNTSVFGCEFGDNTTMYITNTILGSFGFIILSCLIASKQKNLHMLQFLGKHSMEFLVIHFYITAHAINAAWGLINSLEAIHLPHIQCSSFAFTFTICLTLVLCEIKIQDYLAQKRLRRRISLIYCLVLKRKHTPALSRRY